MAKLSKAENPMKLILLGETFLFTFLNLHLNLIDYSPTTLRGFPVIFIFFSGSFQNRLSLLAIILKVEITDKKSQP